MNLAHASTVGGGITQHKGAQIALMAEISLCVQPPKTVLLQTESSTAILKGAGFSPHI
ncbi:MAG TPA: hypothetical protein VE291_05930 [Terracidiphilus sp.]|nr:hypothetical protein [Terracidiphilus sp.]